MHACNAAGGIAAAAGRGFRPAGPAGQPSVRSPLVDLVPEQQIGEVTINVNCTASALAARSRTPSTASLNATS
jgi:hypothetical protein